jgi:transmembrane sensor
MPDNKDNKILNALMRYFSGNRSETGEEVYNKWFDSFDDSQGYLNRLDKQEIEEHRKRVFRSVKKRLDENTAASSAPLHKRHPGKRSALFRIAVILITGCLLSLASLYMSGILKPVEVPVAEIEKSNPAGQITEFRLPDGSIVWLSVASSLKYPEKFSGTDRTVELTGEAFFEVERDEERPFVVNSGPLSTHVSGTSFNVKAYPEDDNIEITLASGEVEIGLKREGQKQLLKPNQQFRFERETGISEIRETDASLTRAWTQRELVFIRENFATIARTFERRYGVGFVFENEELKEETFVYHFKELSLQNSMIVLKELADFDYEIESRQVIVKTASE